MKTAILKTCKYKGEFPGINGEEIVLQFKEKNIFKLYDVIIPENIPTSLILHIVELRGNTYICKFKTCREEKYLPLKALIKGTKYYSFNNHDLEDIKNYKYYSFTKR
jgi:hypothetical protein